ncbi:MAG: Tim44/TimA family putative adaptor protein [Pseudolabrys sp.]|nr:Tim44/TimA family putative adaptor protein [Pseudolabrys sp.]
MTQDETNVMVLFILIGIVWSLVRSAIDQYTSKSDSRGTSLASLVRQNQTLAEISGVGNPTSGFGELATDVVRDLELIRRIDPTFDAGKFLDSGSLVYEAIVQAFAKGDRDLLRELVSEEVYYSFLEKIQARERRGESVELTIVCIENAEIAEVSLFNQQVQITLVFSAQLVTTTRAGNGMVVDGDAKKVRGVHDRWTFACELTSKNLVWQLVATDAA